MKKHYVLAFLFVAVFCPTVFSGEMTEADRTEIKNLIQAFVQSWLKNDSDGVMSVFDTKAVLMPHHGVQPIEGADAIRKFWWPEGGPPVNIEEFSKTVDEVGGDDPIGYARGHFSLRWNSQGQTMQNAGTFLMVLRKNQANTWRITHYMWDDPPNQVIERRSDGEM